MNPCLEQSSRMLRGLFFYIFMNFSEIYIIFIEKTCFYI